MEKYKNVHNLSSVSQYEIGDDFIIVEFKPDSGHTHTAYKYTYDSASKEDVERMKTLAKDGWGLNSYINSRTKNRYAEVVK